MALDGINIIEDTEMADCEADKVVTMVDVLQEQQDFEEDANAVLGASDANNCTYSQGYIKRQAIYACLTCCPESKNNPDKRAGVCLACSLNCHENHDLIELYTKRNFRCDCGNPKFNSNPCQFITNKDDLNSNNMYNHNFSGLYCICKRPYPDPEAAIDEDMIQCVICEDWLHASHLNAVIPPNDQYSEMICKGCMDRNDFLHDYSSLAVNNESIEVDVITVNGDKNSVLCNGDATNEIMTNGNSEIDSDMFNGDVDMAENENNPKKQKQTSCNEEIDNVQSVKVNSMDNIEKDTEMEADSPKETTVPNTLEQITDSEIEDKITNIDDETRKTTGALNQSGSEEQREMTADETNKNSDIDKTDDKSLDSQQQDLKVELEIRLEDVWHGTIKTINENAETEEFKTNEKSIHKDIKTDSEYNCNSAATETTAVTENQNKSDDKDSADSVMDAISELLDDPKDKTNNESNGNNKNACVEKTTNKDGTNNADVANIFGANVPEAEIKCAVDNKKLNSDSDKKESIPTVDGYDETDKEMTDIDNEKLNTDMIDNKSVEEQTDTDSDKKGSIPTADGCDETAKQLETLNDSENSTPVSNNSDKIDSDVEMINNTSKKQSDDLNALVMTDPVPPANDNNTTNNDSEMMNNTEKHEPIDTSVNTETKETSIIDQVEDESAVTNKNNKSSDINHSKEISNSMIEHKRKFTTDMPEEASKKAKLDIDKCIRPKGVKKVFKGATFWPPNFRQLLCTCGECISMYKDLQVLFLTDLEDTVSYYESLGKQKEDAGASQYERGLEALSSLNRMQQINALTEYNNMRDRLLDFLKSFKDRQEVVKEEDIRAFFADMKPRREPDGVYFCR